MRIQLSDHFTYSRLIRFVFPSIVMMIFTSIYGVVDGLFVSNLIGKTPFAAINLIWPYLMGLTVVGFMIGSGGTALVSRSLGEGKKERANQEFSLLVYVTIAIGLVFTVLGLVTLRPVAILFGAKGELLDIAVRYGRIVALALMPFMLQTTFQTFFITAEKPKLGLLVTVLAGLTNMVLDALFIAVFRWGVEGAALATAMSQVVGGIVPLIYFARPNNSLLRLTKTRWNGRALWTISLITVLHKTSPISSATNIANPLLLVFLKNKRTTERTIKKIPSSPAHENNFKNGVATTPAASASAWYMPRSALSNPAKVVSNHCAYTVIFCHLIFLFL